MYNDRHIKKSGLPVARHSSAIAQRARVNEDSPFIKKVLISSLIGLGVNVGAGLLLVTISCIIAIFMNDPLSLIMPLALLSLLVSNFFGGFTSSKIAKDAPFICGLITAGAWCVLSLLVSLCLWFAPASGYALWQSLLLHAISAVFSVLGALTGSYKPKKNPKRHRRFGR